VADLQNPESLGRTLKDRADWLKDGLIVTLEADVERVRQSRWGHAKECPKRPQEG